MAWFGKSRNDEKKGNGRRHEERPLPKEDGRSLEQRAGDFGVRVITTPPVDEKTSTCQIEGTTYEASVLKRGGRTQFEAELNLLDYARTSGIAMISVLRYEPSKLIPNGTTFIAGAYALPKKK